jgi:hypothetical protein
MHYAKGMPIGTYTFLKILQVANISEART